MKKAISLIMSAVMLIGALAACSAPAANTSASAPTATEAPAASSTETAAPEAAPAATEEPVNVAPLKVGVMGTSTKPVGVLVASSLGYFNEEGVEVEFQKVSGMNDAFLAVSTGDLDLHLFSSTAAATFISQGTDTLRIIGGTAAEGSEIMAKPGSGIELNSAEDFVGLKIGCFMAETGQVVLKNWLTEQGYTIGEEGADVTFVYYSDTSSAMEAVKNGEFDLILTNSSLGYYEEKFGVEVVARVSDFVPTYPCCRQTCNSNTIANNREALVRFETAAIRGYAFAIQNMEETLDILVEYSGEDRDFLQAQIYGVESYSPAMRISLDPDKTACVKFYEAMMSLGQVQDTVEVDWNDYVITDIYEEALQRAIAEDPDCTVYADMLAYFQAHN